MLKIRQAFPFLPTEHFMFVRLRKTGAGELRLFNSRNQSKISALFSIDKTEITDETSYFSTSANSAVRI